MPISIHMEVVMSMKGDAHQESIWHAHKANISSSLIKIHNFQHAMQRGIVAHLYLLLQVQFKLHQIWHRMEILEDHLKLVQLGLSSWLSLS